MKAKTSVLDHIKFTAMVVGLMSSWVVAMLWLLTINR